MAGWQAGDLDSNSRVFNIGLNYNATTEARDGEAYFGYGDDIASSSSTAGTIKGFICNWPGPSASHTLKDYAQRQNISFNDTSGKWRPTSEATSSSNITYAPTNSCEVASGTTFYYDKNASGSIADEVAAAVTSPPNPAVVKDLFGKTTYADIPSAIAGRGMVVPSY